MTTLILSTTFAWDGWQGILLRIVIAVIVLWGIQAICAAYNVVIPPIIRIVAIVLGCILVVYWMFALFNALA